MAACQRGAAALIRRGRVSSSFSYYLATRAPPRAAAADGDCHARTGPNLPLARRSSCVEEKKQPFPQQQQQHRTEISLPRRGSLNPIGGATAFLKPIASEQLQLQLQYQLQYQFARGYAAGGDLPPHQEIGMPSLSPTMTQGNIAGWKKKEGDQVLAGDVLCEIETDKATIEMESMEEGYLAKIVVADGAKDVKVGDTICIVVENKDDIPKFSSFQPSGDGGGGAPPPKQEEAPQTESAPPQPSPPAESKESSPPPPPKSKPSAPSSGTRIFASPAAKKLAADKNVALDSIGGTGPDGYIVKADIEDYLASGSSQGKKKAPTAQPAASTGDAAPADSEGLDYSKLSSNELQKLTARRLVQSKQTIPHYYLTLDTRVDKILELQEQLNRSQEAAKREKLSTIDFLIKAAALATRKVPEVNSSWTEDAIRQYNNVNISVAIQSEQLVPVVKEADRKGLAAISEEIKVLVEKVKSNSLEPADYQGGTFAITYLGEEHGVKQISAILHPPQSCVLAIGKSENRVIPGLEAGEFVLGKYISVTLSCDHRVVDGAIGARWLGAFKEYVEDPITLLL